MTAHREARLAIYGTVATRDALMAMYDARLRAWPVAFDASLVATRYGTTHVIASGDRDAPPLVLLHAMGIASVAWSSIVAALSTEHRVYAVDTIGDVGRSELVDARRHPKRGRQYSEWLEDVYEGIGVEQSDFVGWSMGAWIAMHRAIEAPERVRRLVLLAPMGLPTWRATAASMGPMMINALRPTDARRERMLDRTLGSDEHVNLELRPWMRLLASCRPRVAPPLTIASRSLRKVRAPTLVLLGADDGIVGDAQARANRARRHLPECEVEIVPNAGHAMSVEQPDLVASRILRFLSSE